jgi:two-component system, NarL family, nitrate/nitrite sensor histidine kinase NarX
VTLEPRPDLAVEVRDDGLGFDLAARSTDEAHVGLRIMRERAAGIGARVEVHSVRGEGTRVRVTVPARADTEPLAA